MADSRQRSHRQKPSTTKNARRLRRESTVPERILWGLLRNAQIGGLKFRRQKPIGPYIVDFCCEAQNLIVELDGQSHVGQADADEARTIALEAAGYQVIRFTNDEVLESSEDVANAIARAAGLNW